MVYNSVVETEQNETLEKSQTAIKPYKTVVFDHWLTWKACGGLIVDEEDNRIYKMTLNDFCQHFGIAKSTANAWRNNTPNLSQLIEKRRDEIAPMAKVGIVFNQMFLTAMQSKDLRAAVDAQKTYLGHFGNLRLPVQREEIKHEGLSWAELANQKRQVIEAEVINADPNPTNS